MWKIVKEDLDLVITGPGELELVLKNFDPKKITIAKGLPEELLGGLDQKNISYILDIKNEHGQPVTFDIISTRDGERALNKIDIGDICNWEISDKDAEMFFNFFEVEYLKVMAE